MGYNTLHTLTIISTPFASSWDYGIIDAHICRTYDSVSDQTIISVQKIESFKQKLTTHKNHFLVT